LLIGRSSSDARRACSGGTRIKNGLKPRRLKLASQVTFEAARRSINPSSEFRERDRRNGPSNHPDLSSAMYRGPVRNAAREPGAAGSQFLRKDPDRSGSISESCIGNSCRLLASIDCYPTQSGNRRERKYVRCCRESVGVASRTSCVLSLVHGSTLLRLRSAGNEKSRILNGR
jgi:hypothetical protein